MLSHAYPEVLVKRSKGDSNSCSGCLVRIGIRVRPREGWHEIDPTQQPEDLHEPREHTGHEREERRRRRISSQRPEDKDDRGDEQPARDHEPPSEDEG